MTRCKACRRLIGPNRLHGYCYACEQRHGCYWCKVYLGKPGYCRECRRVSEMIHEAHLGECDTKRDDVDERIAMYTERARAGLPLFSEVQGCQL